MGWSIPFPICDYTISINIPMNVPIDIPLNPILSFVGHGPMSSFSEAPATDFLGAGDASPAPNAATAVYVLIGEGIRGEWVIAR